MTAKSNPPNSLYTSPMFESFCEVEMDFRTPGFYSGIKMSQTVYKFFFVELELSFGLLPKL